MSVFICFEPEANKQDIRLLRGLEKQVFKYIKKNGRVSLSELQMKFCDEDEDILQLVEDLKLKYLVYCSIQEK